MANENRHKALSSSSFAAPRRKEGNEDLHPRKGMLAKMIITKKPVRRTNNGWKGEATKDAESRREEQRLLCGRAAASSWLQQNVTFVRSHLDFRNNMVMADNSESEGKKSTWKFQNKTINDKQQISHKRDERMKRKSPGGWHIAVEWKGEALSGWQKLKELEKIFHLPFLCTEPAKATLFDGLPAVVRSWPGQSGDSCRDKGWNLCRCNDWGCWSCGRWSAQFFVRDFG